MSKKVLIDFPFISDFKEADQLRENIYELTATLLACGIDVSKSKIFLQSTIPQQPELCWILSCLCTMIRLSHLPQFKEKSAQVQHVQAGLFLYPILQAADILVHRYGLPSFLVEKIEKCHAFLSICQSYTRTVR